MTEVNEGSVYSYQVTAKDPDRDDMNFTLPTKPAWLSMNSGGLIAGVAPEVNLDTNVNLEARVSDGEVTTRHSFTVVVKDVFPIPTSGGGGGTPPSPPPSTPPRMLTVSGTLQNSETDMGAAGEVRAYKINSDGRTYTLLKKENADSNGVFNMSFSHSGNFDLQARLMDGSSDDSYVRTVPLSSTSTLTGLKIRAVPYTDLDKTQTVDATDTKVSIPEFKSFMEDVNQGLVVSGRGNTLAFKRWNLDNLKGIEILNYNPTSNTGSFSMAQQNHIEGRIKDSEDIKILFDGRMIDVQKDTATNQDMNKKYSVTGSHIVSDLGWIVVVPVQDLDHIGQADGVGKDSNDDGYLDRYRIDLRSTSLPNTAPYIDSDKTITHEFAHVTLYSGGDHKSNNAPDGHTNKLAIDQSITSVTVSGRTGCTKPCTFDKKAAKLIYEDTFVVGTPYSEILGTDWRLTN